MLRHLSLLPALTGEVRAMIIEDHTIFAFGMRCVLQRLGIQVCTAFPDWPSALAEFDRLKPNLVVLNIDLRGNDGFRLLADLLTADPLLRVLTVALHAKVPQALTALLRGARGYAHKSQLVGEMEEALKVVMAGGTYLNPALQEGLTFKALSDRHSPARAALDSLSTREQEVFESIGHDLTTKQIAEALRVSAKTVETHRAHIKEKFRFSTGAALSEFAREWVSVSPVPSPDRQPDAGVTHDGTQIHA